MDGGGRRTDLAGDVSVAESIEAPRLGETLSDIEDLRHGVGANRKTRPVPERDIDMNCSSPSLDTYLSIGQSMRSGTGRRGRDHPEDQTPQLAAPEETHEFPHGRAEIVRIGASEVGRLDLRAGMAVVERREADRRDPQLYSATFPVPRERPSRDTRMDDGSGLFAGPGDVTSLPSGHDAWVVGEEPVVIVDWFASSYAKEG